MSSYPIDFSDPLKSGFLIPPGGLNGPTGSASNTTLRLYGRGALEWGEAVNEDLVRLTENFASATPPKNPIGGQLWYETKFYYRNTSAGTVYQGWYRYNLGTNTWELLNTTGVVPATATSGQTYYYDNASSTLYGFYSITKPEAQVFVKRSFFEGTGSPGSVAPPQTLRVWDAYANSGAGTWSAPSTVSVSSAVAPTNPQPGTFWLDTSTGKLKMWSGTQWQEIIGPSSGTVANTARTNIDMDNTFRVVNLPTPTAAGDAASKAYVDAQLTGTISGYVPLNGGTMVSPGHLTSPGNLNFAGSATVGTLTAASATVSGSGTFGSLTVNGAITAGGQIKSVTAGTLGTDAVNVTQLNGAISTAIGSLGGITGSTVPLINTGGTYKTGDISINGGKIYIAAGSGTGAAPGGNWKQVWPATYA